MPVVVWLVASVLGGAAIGSAVEPDHKATETPTTIEIETDEVDAAACDPASDADPDDVNRPSFGRARPTPDADTLRLTKPPPRFCLLQMTPRAI